MKEKSVNYRGYIVILLILNLIAIASIYENVKGLPLEGFKCLKSPVAYLEEKALESEGKEFICGCTPVAVPQAGITIPGIRLGGGFNP